jgi:hypothetical protein
MRIRSAFGLARDQEVARHIKPVIDAVIHELDRDQDERESRFRREIDAELRQLKAERAATGQSVSINLRLLPDELVEAEALAALTKLRDAVSLLHDTNGLSSGQRQVIEDLIFPRISELEALLNATAASPAEAEDNRTRALGIAWGLLERAVTVGTVIQLADDTTEKIQHHAGEVIDAAGRLEWIWNLILRVLLHS